jgi:acetyltransferase-like isoleucine patch superfamily enzyme
MRFAAEKYLGRVTTRIATLLTPPYKSRHYLASLYEHGFIAPGAIIHHDRLHLGKNVYIGGGVIIHKRQDGGEVVLGDRVVINEYTIIEVGKGGSLLIGDGTTIQPRCQFSAYVGHIRIGSEVQIAPSCAFYPYDHSMEPGRLMKEQPLRTRGGITIGDDAWIGYGVIVLDGVNIGEGAVIGAGSVVKTNIPDGAIAVGVPARIVKSRSQGH